MAQKAQNGGVLSALGEGGMITLLVVLFVSPFVVASLLTPKYEPTATQAEQSNEWPVNNSDKTILGAKAVAIKDFRMQVVQGNGLAEVDSYVTSKTDGRFLYRITNTGDGTVFKLVNEGTLVSTAKVRVGGDFEGVLRAGNTVLGEEFAKVKVAPGSTTDITLDANSLGSFDLWIVVE